MITNFRYCTEENIDIEVNLGFKVDFFTDIEEERILKYLYSQSKGVKWNNQGKEIKIFEKNQKISGYPTTDLLKTIVIFPMNHNLYGAPDNAVVYNADGSIYLQLKSPVLISEVANKRKLFSHSSQFSLLYFEKVSWEQNSDGKIVTAVTISFDRDWREVRVLDTETGEFGECLSSSMR